MIKEKPFQDAVAYRVYFDDDKGFKKAHRVRWQSTVIVFKGMREVGRSTADVNKNSLRKLMVRGL